MKGKVNKYGKEATCLPHNQSSLYKHIYKLVQLKEIFKFLEDVFLSGPRMLQSPSLNKKIMSLSQWKITPHTRYPPQHMLLFYSAAQW